MSRLVPSTRPTGGTASGLWPTPMAHEARLGYQRRRGESKGSQESLTTVVVNVSAPLDDPRIVGLWPTPTSLAPARNGNNEAGNSAGLVAIRAHLVHLWNTPVADDTGMRTKPYVQGGTPLSLMAATALGLAPDGSSATTEKPGALDPTFVAWLMGFPLAWLECAPAPTPKRRKG